MSASTEKTLARTEELARVYGDAWNAHDLETIMSEHAEGMVFHLHIEGFEEATQPEEVHAQFAFFFKAFPDLHFETKRLEIREQMIVHEFVISGTLVEPFPVGAESGIPNGRKAYFDGVDVLPCKDGKIMRKDTYLDGVAFRRQLLETTGE